MQFSLIRTQGDGHAASEAAQHPPGLLWCRLWKSANVAVINGCVGSTSVLKADEY